MNLDLSYHDFIVLFAVIGMFVVTDFIMHNVFCYIARKSNKHICACWDCKTKDCNFYNNIKRCKNDND